MSSQHLDEILRAEKEALSIIDAAKKERERKHRDA